MTLVSRPRVFVALFLITITATPLLAAATKRRAVGPLPDVTITGIVTDAANGLPIKGVEIFNGVARSAPTGSDGKYTIKLPANRPTLITATYFAFQSQTKTVTPNAGVTQDFSLVANPAITVKMTNGETIVLDFGTTQFAYVIVFAGYVRDDSANICRPDGSSFAPNKNAFKRITGPATHVNFAPCCSSGAVEMVNIEMKSGEKTQAYFNDSCFGNEEDLIGRERSTGLFRYLSFKDIAQVDFP